MASIAVTGMGQSLPAVRVVATPAAPTNALATLTAPLGLGVSGLPAAPSAAALPARSASFVPAARAAAMAAPVAAARIQNVRTEVAPHLDAAVGRDTSPSGLRASGVELQRVLEEALPLRPAASVETPGHFEPANASGLTPAAAPAAAPASASLPAPELSPEAKSKFYFYSGAVSAVKVGIEALNLAVPLLLLNTLHAAMAVSALYIAAEAASIFAGLAGGALVDRIGARRAMVGTGFVQALAIAGVPLAITSGGALALPIVYGLFMLNGVASELFDVARRAAMPQIVGQDEGLLRKYNGGLYVWREIAATAGVFGAGWLVHHLGAMTTIWAHPAFCIAAVFAALRLLRGGSAPIAAETSAVTACAQAPRSGFKAALKSWWEDLRAGARYVVSEKKLRTIVLVNIPLNALHKIFHTLVAVVYATQVLHNPAMAAVLLGVWNIGELAGAFYLVKRGTQSRLSNWMRLAAAASLGVWGFYLLPSLWAGILVSFVLAATMIGNELGTASYLQSTVPQKELGSVTGFVYGFARAVGMLALLATGLAFDRLGADGGFLALSVIFTVCAPVYFFAARRFTKERLEPPSQPLADLAPIHGLK